MDLNKRSTHDYVDNPFFSMFQIRVKYLLHSIYVDQHKSKLIKLEEDAKLTSEEQAWRDQELSKDSSKD
jgi:hypothetical protein